MPKNDNFRSSDAFGKWVAKDDTPKSNPKTHFRAVYRNANGLRESRTNALLSLNKCAIIKQQMRFYHGSIEN